MRESAYTVVIFSPSAWIGDDVSFVFVTTIITDHFGMIPVYKEYQKMGQKLVAPRRSIEERIN